MTELPRADARSGPGSLADRANQTLLALADRADRKKTEAELTAITVACNRAETLVASLKACLRIGEQISSLDVEYVRPALSPAAAKAIPNLRRAATEATNPDRELAERLRGGAVQEALKAAETTAAHLERALTRAAAEEQRRLAPADLGRPIPAMPGHESLQYRISRIKLSLSRPYNGTAQEAPAAIEQWRRDSAAWEEVRAEIDRRLAELPSEIKAFVEAAAGDNGAPWSLVTPAVRLWLDRDGNGEGYGVRKW
ncbi:hypothetical protein ACGFI9_23015 [Micromonospora sp. NPDC048930]|uniref:hypothetical protein n=1 Tax=Micromonospora sp. NPDC048930 TaxID=3364261 RepID=UPI003721C40A